MKSQGKMAVRQLIENQPGATSAAVWPVVATGTGAAMAPAPFAAPARPPAPRDPRGGATARHPLPLAQRPAPISGIPEGSE